MAAPRKTIIVTGGASGIGLGITRSFASQGHHVSIFDINHTAGIELAASLSTEFPQASITFHQCDISSWSSQAEAFAAVMSAQGHIDIVMANAGITEKCKLIVDEDTPSQPNLVTLDVNLIGTIYTVKLAIHYLRLNNNNCNTNSRGTIICTASNAGIYPFPIAPIYSATKAGVIGLVRSLARPLEPLKIQIHALAPAVLETNIAPSRDLFKTMILTPMETLTRAVDILIQSSTSTDNISGKIAEVHGDQVSMAEPPPYVDEDSEKNLENFWAQGYA